jgi:hypothetical protein
MQSNLLAQQLEFLQLEANEAKARERNLQEFNDKLMNLLSAGCEPQPHDEQLKQLQAQVEDLTLQLTAQQLDLEALRNSKDTEITKLNDKIIRLEAANKILKVDIDRLMKSQEGSLKQTEDRYKQELRRSQDVVNELVMKSQSGVDRVNAEWKSKLASAVQVSASENEVLNVQLHCLQTKVNKLTNERKCGGLEDSYSSYDNSELTASSQQRKPQHCKFQQHTEEIVSQLQKRYGEAMQARDMLITQLKQSNSALHKQVKSLKSDLNSASLRNSSQDDKEKLLTDEVKLLIGKLMKAKSKLKAQGLAGVRNDSLQGSIRSNSRMRFQAESFAQSFNRSFSSLDVV